MKNEMILSAEASANTTMVENTTGITPPAWRIATLAGRTGSLLAGYYSQLLGTKVTVRQTLLLLNAQTAFLFTVFPADCHMLLRCACARWLVSALLKCRNSGIKAPEL